MQTILLPLINYGIRPEFVSIMMLIYLYNLHLHVLILCPTVSPFIPHKFPQIDLGSTRSNNYLKNGDRVCRSPLFDIQDVWTEDSLRNGQLISRQILASGSSFVVSQDVGQWYNLIKLYLNVIRLLQRRDPINKI